ncbi:NrfD/PsrC family molybdoenzyme membrane anchor subunit [Thiobacter aerophilum]|uniref:NrfD/PsrC family molybdoenzyme membrane anchor subunit n=1 Tax=Thiobacter aerophilum TaxID=3121275 RepID=A0ABV0EG60_9BURK
MHITYREVEGRSPRYWALLGLIGLFVLIGLGAAWYMEHHGHIVTGMTNQIVWGMPHVFAVFLIVAASGALNAASIASVFGKTAYKPLARLSGLVAVALLAGGLMVLMLDLGRPDRVVVAATYYNFKSVFAWNVFLYTGFFTFVALYLWTMMDSTVGAYGKYAGMAAFIWRLVLTTGTGSIFGFLVARESYSSALLAPMFIVLSFSYGMAVYLLVLIASYVWTGRPLGEALLNRLAKLLGWFIAGALYFVVVFHMTNLYFTKYHGFEKFILVEGGVYTQMFWIGQILLGSVVPMLILFNPKLRASRGLLVTACLLVVLGGLAQMYVTIIGGQAWPLDIFPGWEERSTFFDGVVHPYSPSLPEVLLGIGGVAVALAIVTIGVKVLRFLPESLSDADVDPHAAK